MSERVSGQVSGRDSEIRLFLCGDVMTGRGVDQILPHPAKPELHERWMKSAKAYVELAERRSGAVPQPAGFDYVWGDALELWRKEPPDLKIVNLETSVTTSERAVMKGINYRMSPDNVEVLAAAGVDCCVLANNHVLDWGRAGLVETLETLHRAGVATAGAGRALAEARAPAVLRRPGKGRVLVFALAADDCGAPPDWAAAPGRPGLSLCDLSRLSAEALGEDIERVRQPGDVVVVSIHWGANWGYGVPEAHRRFAHMLIEEAGVAIVHGHSSHHPLAVEVHQGRLVLYGCGDFLSDYEGISGHEAFRPDLVLGFQAEVDPAGGALLSLRAVPFKLARLRLNRPVEADAEAALAVLNRESRSFGVHAERAGEGFAFAWEGAATSPPLAPRAAGP